MFTIKMGENSFVLDKKTPILDLIKENNKTFFAAKVNNRLRELNYDLCYDSTVELLDLNNSDAVKVYETSLRYLLAMAFHNIYPDYEIKINYGISRSLQVSIIQPDKKIDSKIVKAIEEELDRLVKQDLLFERVKTSKEEATKLFIEYHDVDKIDALKYRPESDCHMTKCGNYYNYMYGYQVPSTGYIKTYKLFQYDGQMIVQYPRYEVGGVIPPFVDAPTFSKVIKDARVWAKLCKADYVAKINDQLTDQTYVDFINLCETKHNDMLAELGDIISNNIDDIRLICIAGPSSSGKTTFSNRLKIELMSKGIIPLRISLDMYYKPISECPLDEDGKPDFEHIDALDVEKFNQDMLGLINGDEVRLPIFDFETKEKKLSEPIRIDSKTPIIIEGIHALNNKLSYLIPAHQKYKIFIAPQFQINLDNHNPISYTDIRLLRRIVRDRRTRNTSAEGTISMWRSVRRGEFKWIYPYQEGCNYVYNSGLTYEICVMKKYALPALKEIPQTSPYYITANRLIKFLKYFKDMDETYVPCNSLLREFIGGSCFRDA